MIQRKVLLVFTFICFLTSMIFWLVFACVWRVLFLKPAPPQSKRVTTLHECTVHSFSTLLGLFLSPLVLMLIVSLPLLKDLVFVETAMYFCLAMAMLISSFYLVRTVRSLF